MALPRGHVRYFHALMHLIIHMTSIFSQAELNGGFSIIRRTVQIRRANTFLQFDLNFPCTDAFIWPTLS